MTVEIVQGDCRAVLAEMQAESFSACVTDPPYHLVSQDKRPATRQCPHAHRRVPSAGFMGQAWDGGDVAFQPETWAAVYRVLKPGAHLLAFGGTRTFHRLACAIEDAGFEIRDTIMWLYGSGFSKVGMLKNRAPEMWCKCNGEQATEYDVRSLREANLSATVHSGDQRGEVLLPGVQEHSSSLLWEAWPEPEAGRREQSSMEGRTLRRAGQGLCDGPQPRAPESEGERVRLRAHYSGGGDDRQAVSAGRGSPPQGSQQGEQRPGEPSDLREPPRALGNGAHGNGARCPRCGGISRAFDGFGGSLKPACEPIVVARKPLSEGTVAANVLRHGTGAVNVDACRVACDPVRTVQGQSSRQQNGEMYSGCDQRNLQQFESHANGRWPANVCHDGSPEVLDAFSRFGERPSGAGNKHANGNGPHNVFSGGPLGWGEGDGIGGDTGTAARFFKGCKFEPGEIQHALRFAFHSKADSSERVGSHPTVKPAALMEWLVQLITPPGGRVLDPFCGTGSSLVACDRLGFDALGIEQDAQTVADANEKIRRMRARRFIGDAERVPVPEGQLGLF